MLSFHVLVPLPTTFSADYQRQLAEIGITMGCLCDKRLSCWHILLHTIVKRGEGCVPQAADMRLAVRFLSHEPRASFRVAVPCHFVFGTMWRNGWYIATVVAGDAHAGGPPAQDHRPVRCCSGEWPQQ